MHCPAHLTPPQPSQALAIRRPNHSPPPPSRLSLLPPFSPLSPLSHLRNQRRRRRATLSHDGSDGVPTTLPRSRRRRKNQHTLSSCFFLLYATARGFFFLCECHNQPVLRSRAISVFVSHIESDIAVFLTLESSCTSTNMSSFLNNNIILQTPFKYSTFPRSLCLEIVSRPRVLQHGDRMLKV